MLNFHISFAWHVLLPILATAFCLYDAKKILKKGGQGSHGWFDGLYEGLVCIIYALPILMIWLIYFITLYFTK